MSLLKGNLSYRKFKIFKINVEGEEITKETFKKFAFKTGSVGIAGFTSPFLVFDSEVFYDFDLLEGVKLVGIRCDNYAFSASQMRPYIERIEVEEMKKTGKLYLRSEKKKEIKEAVLKLFKASNFPKPEFCEVLIKDNFVYMFSQKESMAGHLQSLFNLLGYHLEEIMLIDDSIERKQTSLNDFVKVGFDYKGE